MKKLGQVLVAGFFWRQPARIKEEMLESGNLFSGSRIPPL